jgi:predicted ferric reductase
VVAGIGVTPFASALESLVLQKSAENLASSMSLNKPFISIG